MLSSVYLHELFGLATTIRNGCDEIFSGAPVPEKDMYIKVAPDLHASITHVLLSAANIKKLLHPAPQRRKKESKAAYEYRILRGQELRTGLEGIHLKEILNSHVRNSIEHFDEYLDEEIRRITDKGPEAPMAAYNMAISHWAVTKPRVHPIKLYVAEERRFYNFTHTVNLDRMHIEATALLAHLKRLEAFKGLDEPGGLMIPLNASAPSA